MTPLAPGWALAATAAATVCRAVLGHGVPATACNSLLALSHAPTQVTRNGLQSPATPCNPQQWPAGPRAGILSYFHKIPPLSGRAAAPESEILSKWIKENEAE